MIASTTKSSGVGPSYLNRWLVFEGDETAKLEIGSFDRVVADEVPERLVEWLTSACAAIPGGAGDLWGAEISSIETGPPITVTVSFGAEEVLRAVIAKQEERRTNKSDPVRDIWVRLFENTIKVAAVRAIADSSVEPIMERRHAEWARDLVEWCIENTAYMVRSRVADSEREKQAKAIWRFIHEAGPDGRDLQHVTKKFNRIDRRQRREILDDLQEFGAITRSEAKRDGAVEVNSFRR